MSLTEKIRKVFVPGKKVAIQELYIKFPDQLKTTIRGRLYDCLGKSVKRIGKGLYISATSIVEFGDSTKIIDRIIESNEKFDFIFLDIPYEGRGQRSSKSGGGNRDLAKFTKINPEEFQIFLSKCKQTLRTKDSFICFMFTSGRSSESEFKKYHNAFNALGFKRSVTGYYEKLWKTGNPMNMGKYKMPLEHIIMFNESGNNLGISPADLQFSLTPDFQYPTSKPYEMIETIIRITTKIKEWVYDPFGGSGKILKACQKLGRCCHITDCNPISIYKHILPILK